MKINNSSPIGMFRGSCHLQKYSESNYRENCFNYLPAKSCFIAFNIIKNCYSGPKWNFLVVSWICNSRTSPEALRVPFNTNHLSKTSLRFFLSNITSWRKLPSSFGFSLKDNPDYVGSLLMLLKVDFYYDHWKVWRFAPRQWTMRVLINLLNLIRCKYKTAKN